MQSTKDYLEAVRRFVAKQEKKPISEISDYKIAKRIGVSAQTISQIQNHGQTFLPLTALKVAELIGEDPMRVIAVAEAERAKSPEDRARWKKWATAAMFASALIGGGIFYPSPASAASKLPYDVYYVKSKKGLRRQAWVA